MLLFKSINSISGPLDQGVFENMTDKLLSQFFLQDDTCTVCVFHVGYGLMKIDDPDHDIHIYVSYDHIVKQ